MIEAIHWTKSPPIRFFITGFCIFVSPQGMAAEVDFAHQVLPILKKHCAECHAGEAKKGGLSMNTRAALLEGSEWGVVVKPGDADDGPFMELILSTDRTEKMPPKGDRVSPAEIAVLRDWINGGMPWDEGVTLGEDGYEPPLKPRLPELPPALAGRDHPVDRIIDRHFEENSMERPAPLGDSEFIRRVSLDLTGLLADPARVAAFTADPDPDKREKLVSSLLADDVAYTEHWLSLWNDLLRNDYRGTGYIDGGRKQVTDWLYKSLLENKPYDEFARDLLAPPSPASAGFIGGIKWRGSVNASQTVEVQFAQSVTQTFLGLNMKCASCHDSFVDRWKLEEAYGLAAIYAEKPLEIARCDVPTGKTAKAAWIFPELGEIDGNAPRPERLKQMAALMTHPENGRFTRTIVNRLWERLMGRGIIHPVDAMDAPPWNADLLDYLAVRFAEDGYDLKKALAFITSSQIYQSRSVVIAASAAAPFQGPVAKRMTAEQFVDAVWTLTGGAPGEADKSIPRPTSALRAKWIWADSGASASAPAGQKIALGTQVDLPAFPSSAKAVFMADNEAEIFINGQRVAREIKGPAARNVDLTHFREGSNSIVVVATNTGESPNPAGFILEALLEFPGAEPVILATDSSWKWTPGLPGSDGRFASPPGNWAAAHEAASPAVWASLTKNLRSSRAQPMVRASLVASDLLMRALGRPNREQIVSMRPDNITTLEAIDLANGGMLADLLRQGAQRLAKEDMSSENLVDSVFMHALGRPATSEESSLLRETLGIKPAPKAIEDLLWLILLLPEFQFVR